MMLYCMVFGYTAGCFSENDLPVRPWKQTFYGCLNFGGNNGIGTDLLHRCSGNAQPR